MHRIFSLVVIGSLILSGCARDVTRPAPVEDRTPAATPPVQTEPSEVVVRPLPRFEAGAANQGVPAVSDNPNVRASEPRSTTANPTQASTSSSPAVLALATTAAEAENAGQHDKAAASLERALRIEPDNPTLWHRLAQVRFNEQRWIQAEAFAAKSNRLAGNNRDLRRKNLALIATARRARGDRAGAASASREANLLR